MYDEKLTKCPNFTRHLPEKKFSLKFGGTCPLVSGSYAYAADVRDGLDSRVLFSV